MPDCEIVYDKETLRLINKHNLTDEDVEDAVCLILQKYRVCPCSLRNAKRKAVQQAPVKSE